MQQTQTHNTGSLSLALDSTGSDTIDALFLSAAWLPFIFFKASAGAVAVVTNTRGSPDYVHMGGRRVESIYGFVPLPLGIPVGVAVSRYAGRMGLALTPKPYAVPDADRVMSWVLEEYLSLLLNKAKQVDKDCKHGK
jgi:hypothetical protein